MDTSEIKNMINKINLPAKQSEFEYNPMEVFVEKVREKEICHTAIIADLLNPYGKHRMGRVFLDSFLECLDVKENLDIIIKKGRTVESCLPNMDKRYIDICIELTNNETKKVIIIENKINNAGEQPEQISDYKNALEKEGFNVLKTVCIQGTCGKDIGAEINISPMDLAKIFTIKEVEDSYNNIKSYLTLLKNMDKNEEHKKIANIIYGMDDEDIKKIRTIALSFNEMPRFILKEIIVELNKKSHNFSENEATGDLYQILEKDGYYIQLWNEESYHTGRNKGFWIEIWFYDFDRFEIWVKQDDKGKSNLQLKNYIKSKKYDCYYVDEAANNMDGCEAKRFEFPNKKEFKEMVDYVSNLYKELYPKSTTNENS